jgi:hypothetical protein
VVSPDLTETLEPLDQQGQTGSQDQLDPRGQRGLGEALVLTAALERPVSLELQVVWEIPVKLVRKGPLVQRVIQDQVGRSDPKVLWGLLDLKEPLDSRGLVVRLVSRAQRDSQGLKELVAPREIKGRQGRLDLLDSRDH